MYIGEFPSWETNDFKQPTHPQFLWPLQRFKDSRGQHLLQGEALKYGVDLEGSHFEQDEPVRVPGAKELHTEAGLIRSDSLGN